MREGKDSQEQLPLLFAAPWWPHPAGHPPLGSFLLASGWCKQIVHFVPGPPSPAPRGPETNWRPGLALKGSREGWCFGVNGWRGVGMEESAVPRPLPRPGSALSCGDPS